MILKLALVALAAGTSAWAQTPPAVSGNLAATGYHTVFKLLQTDPLPTTGMVPVVISAARGEFADFQVFVAGVAGAGLSGVSISLSDFAGPGGAKITSNPNANIYSEFYHNITQASPTAGKVGWTPDALIPVGPDPYYGEPRGPMGTVNSFTIAAGQNQGFWIDLFIPPSTPPGAYNGTVTIKDSANDAVNLRVQLTVWSFVIPPTPSIPSLVGGVSYLDMSKGFFAPGQFAPNGYIGVIIPLMLKQSIRHRMAYAFGSGLGDYKGWSWNGTSIDWNISGPFGATYDLSVGPYLNGSYPGTSDPFLMTGPKLAAVEPLGMGTGGGRYMPFPLATGFAPPATVVTSTQSGGSLAAGRWYYVVTSSVAGQGDSYVSTETYVDLGGSEAAVLSWMVPVHSNGKTPDSFAIYRSAVVNASNTIPYYPYPPPWHVTDTLIAVIATTSTTSMSFVDTGLPYYSTNPVAHYYDATAQTEAVNFLSQFGSHYSQNGWPAPFAYLKDEPHNCFEWDSIGFWADLMRQAGASGQASGLGVRGFDTTSLPDPWGSAAFKQCQRNLIGQLDTWVPNTTSISAGYWPQAYAAEQAAGRHVFFYDSNNSNGRPQLQPSRILDFPALSQRITYWWAARENYEGYLYFATTYGWSQCQDPWTVPNPNLHTTYVAGTNPPQTCVTGFGDNGDGLVVYPGRHCPAAIGGFFCIGGTHDIPVDSMRLKMMRDSEQDLEYLLKLKAGNPGAFKTLLANVFTAPTLQQSLSASAQTIYLSTIAGISVPSGFPDYRVNIEGNEIVDFDGVNATNNTLTPCHSQDPAGLGLVPQQNNYGCRGYFNSGGSTSNNAVGISHPAGAAVQVPPHNVLGSYFGDPNPLLNARYHAACALDPARCSVNPDTTPPSPFRGLIIK